MQQFINKSNDPDGPSSRIASAELPEDHPDVKNLKELVSPRKVLPVTLSSKKVKLHAFNALYDVLKDTLICHKMQNIDFYLKIGQIVIVEKNKFQKQKEHIFLSQEV